VALDGELQRGGPHPLNRSSRLDFLETMPPRSRSVLLAVSLLATLAPPAFAQSRGCMPGGRIGPLPAPPVAPQIPSTTTIFGDTRVDPYAWMRSRTDPRVQDYVAAENAYTTAAMAGTTALQARLAGEMRGRLGAAGLSTPERIGPYLYAQRTDPGRQYPVYTRRRIAPGAAEEVYLDVNELARGHRFLAMGVVKVSPDHRLLAYSADITGAERYTLRFRDLARGADLPERVDGVRGSVEWATDGHTVFYTRPDSTGRLPAVLLRHRLGTDPSADVEVFRERDPRFRVEIYRTRDNRYLVARSLSVTTAEARVVRAERPGERFRLVAARGTGGRYHLQHQGGRFVIYTDLDAPNYRIVSAPERDPAPRHWRDLVPTRDSVTVADYAVFRDHLVLFERANALRPIRIHDLRTGEEHTIPFPEPVYTAYRGSNPEFDTDTLRFVYTSFLTPATAYAYDMRGRVLAPATPTRVPGYDPARYAAERVWATAPDGARVPVSLVYRTPLARDGTRPLLLYGYGAYGISTDAPFDANLLSLLDRGVVYAVAHVRGGQEMGRGWFEGGRLMNKRNSFTDFIAAAETLERLGYTRRGRMVARGGSAGGTLVAAVANLRPDLFCAVVAEAPFTDVLTDMLDTTLTLTAAEWEYWGNPRSAEAYAYIRSYSPYDNVAAHGYPAILATGGMNDTRVDFWQPARWVARLRAAKTDDRLVLLRMDDAGHHGASGRLDAIAAEAFVQAFILDQLGLADR
jgi:oligopeptidase B